MNPTAFLIEKYELNRDHWSEGYITATTGE
jgi:hypothetical protein